jgi:hypothetical protein
MLRLPSDSFFKFFESTSLLVLLVPGLLAGCANSRDREAAREAAARIHSQIRSRSFAAIYDEAADGFKTVEKADFVDGMNGLQDKLGPVKDIKEMVYQTGLDSRVGRTHTLVFDVRFEVERVREILVFVHGNENKLQLWKLDIEPIN